MKILHANSARRWIGEAAHTYYLVRELYKKNISVYLFVRKNWELEKKIKNEKIPFKSLYFSSKFNPLKDFRDFVEAYKIVKKFNPSIIHVHRGKEHWLFAILKLFMKGKFKLVRTRHVVIPNRKHLLNKWLFEKITDHIICVSKKVAEQYKNWNIQNKLSIIYSGVDTTKFNTSVEPLYRKKLGIENKDILIGNIGRFQPIKGQIYFLMAAKEILKKYSNVYFILAGRDKGEQKKFENFIRKNNLEKHIFILNEIKDIEKLIASLDIGVITSLGSEGSSRILFEYMATGKPVIATNVGGIPEIVPEIQRSFIIKPGEVDILVSKIEILINNDKLRKKIGIENLKIIKSNFTLEKWCERTIRVYKRILVTGERK